MTSRTATRPTPPRARGPLALIDWRWAPAIVAGLALLFVVNRVGASPASVDRLTIENASEFAFNVDVAGTARSGWLSLGRTERSATLVLEKVIDQGDTWTFRFTGQGEDGGELRVDRRQLEEQGWRLTIPEAAAQRLRAAGAPSTP